jgi:anionic cell wall polymer biosynthesis LytR-Cps2A-Psr (LCP) family protein
MSLSNETVVLLLQALKSITQDPNQCFTAFDVTKALRSLTAENVRHRDVRNIIHTFHKQDFLKSYTRVSHTFDQNGDDITAELYVPPNGNQYDYDPNQVLLIKVVSDDLSSDDGSDDSSDAIDDLLKDEDEDDEDDDEDDDGVTASDSIQGCEVKDIPPSVCATGIQFAPAKPEPSKQSNFVATPATNPPKPKRQTILDKVKSRFKSKITKWLD